MNYPMVFNILSKLLYAQAVFLVFPAAMALIQGEADTPMAFLIAIGALLVCATAMAFVRPRDKRIFAREGFVIVAVSWIVMSLFGAMPFALSGAIPRYANAFFETVSGFTTTGATVLTDVEVLPKSLLLWRSMTHWIGGMGVLVFLMAVVPLAGDRSMHLVRAETPGPSVGKLVPKLKSSARILYGIYIFLTVLLLVLLRLGGMDWFDSLLHAMSTAGTGGFSTRNASVGGYESSYIHWVITIFMILFSLNFNLYYFLLLGRLRPILKNEELRLFLCIILGATAIITICILPQYQTFHLAVRDAAFQVTSIISTSGFATADYTTWPYLAQIILILVMFIGACAGSTGGGIKVARILLAFKSARTDMGRVLHRNRVDSVKLDDRPVERDTLRGLGTYFTLYFTVLIVCTLLASLDGFDVDTSFTAAVTCINNAGPGLGLVGPSGNFAIFSEPVKVMFSAVMLLGRLEFLPMIMLFSPRVWK